MDTLTIDDIYKKLPAEVFIKEPMIGLCYIFRDLLCWYWSYHLFNIVEQNTITITLYWLSSGFWMWCLFVSGHDCSHGSFSDSWSLNTVVGHICHTPLLTPFSTWAESHRRHHTGHNHIKNDYSHPWIPTHKKNNKNLFLKVIQYTGMYPLVAWFLYLSSIPDGGHWIPIGGKLWRENYKISKHIHALFSSSFCASFLYYVYNACGGFHKFMIYYGGSWCVFAWWIITVTYLQHHSNNVEDTKIYGDESWTYLKGALQTVDRHYGLCIDDLSHNITDCHIIHHIFFSKIPHYKLKLGTYHLYKYLDSQNIKYKRQNTPLFFMDIFKLTISNLNEATLEK